LLAGRRLYPNKTGFDGTRRILTEPPPDIGEVRSDVPPELCELLFEMLAKERASRPATAVEIAGRLEGILAVLIAEEGSVTVGDYMTQHFDHNRQEQRAILAAHLKRIESDGAPTLRSVPVSVPTQPPGGVAGDALAPGRRARRYVGGGLAIVAVAALAAVFWPRPPEQGPGASSERAPAVVATPATPPAIATPPGTVPAVAAPLVPGRASSVGAPSGGNDPAPVGSSASAPSVPAPRAQPVASRAALGLSERRKAAKRTARNMRKRSS
jgi:serine/threonine-protein kinase